MNKNRSMNAMQILIMHWSGRKEGFAWCEVRVMQNANHKVNGVGQSSKANTL